MNNSQLNNLFLRIAEELDISNTLFENAQISYQALGAYIDAHCDYDVRVYTQGSFRLGTVIRPLSDEDEYDLDLVTVVLSAPSITAISLKNLIGNILRDSKRYSAMLEEKKRCWRIEYADEAHFHMDITPGVPYDSVSKSILITQKDGNGVYSYTPSNPEGYSDWFEQRKKIATIQRESVYTASVEPAKTKENTVKLPLQRAVQILKRHRDIMFKENPDIKPISIIVTTLAAMAYTGEIGVYDALKCILEKMDSYISVTDKQYFIPNPTNPKENFADKWNKDPTLAKAFYAWLTKAKSDINTVAPEVIDDYSDIEAFLGDTVVARAVSDILPIAHDSYLPESIVNTPVIQNALSVSHRQKPPFKLPKYQLLGIKATFTQNESTRPYQNNGPAIPKCCSIDFSLMAPPTLLNGGYSVRWQVVNTGAEAREANCLRGGFEREVNSLRWHESSQYRGTHYVQAYLFKRGKCIAMSREFIVNIE